MTNEKRLIDANDTTVKLAANASHVLRNADGDDYAIGRARGIMDAVDLINKLHTVDAVEVVHGRSVAVPSSDMMTGKAYKCSECNKMRYGSFMPNYCQNCGAKMDGDGNG